MHLLQQLYFRTDCFWTISSSTRISNIKREEGRTGSMNPMTWAVKGHDSNPAFTFIATRIAFFYGRKALSRKSRPTEHCWVSSDELLTLNDPALTTHTIQMPRFQERNMRRRCRWKTISSLS